MKKNFIYQIAVVCILLCLSAITVKAQNNGGNDNGGGGNNGNGNHHHRGDNDGDDDNNFMVAAVPELSFAMVATTGGQNSSAISQVAISDMNGNVLISQSYTGNVNVATINYSNLTPNLYILTVSNATTTQAQVLGVNYPLCPPYCGGN